MELSYGGKECEKRKVLRRFRKRARVGADETSQLQRRLSATRKERSPTVVRRVRRITNSEDDDIEK